MIWNCAPGHIESAQQKANEFGIEAVNKWTVPVGSIIRAGGRVAGHGEGVSGDSYFNNMELLVTRKDKAGKVWGKDNAIDRKDLLKMYTIDNADYLARVDRLGSLEPGKLADLVILNNDYMTIPDDQIPTLKPLLTMV